MHEDARIYDLETGFFEDDVAFWQELVRLNRPSSALDLASGTGRLTIPIATTMLEQAAAARIVGLDISEPLLAEARFRRQHLPPNLAGVISYVAGDMTSFRLDQTFDLIICGLNSLQYLYSTDEQLACFRCIRQHLSTGGIFAFDVLTPNLVYLSAATAGPTEEQIEIDRSAPDLGILQLRRYASERYDPATQIDSTDYRREISYADGRVETTTDSLNWYFYFPAELRLLLDAAGLEPVDQWGDYDFSSFGPTSPRYCWTARTRPS